MKGLEALKRIKKSHYIAIAVMGCERDYETEKAIEIVEKEHKALEIIKEKNVNIKLLKASSIVEQYNNELIRVLGRCFAEREFLTLEEYDLLKEVLE